MSEKQQPKQELVLAAKHRELSPSSKEYLRSLVANDNIATKKGYKEALIAKYTGYRVATMTSQEVRIAATLAIARIAVITGWVLPDNATYQETLRMEFAKKMIEDWNDMTYEEIVFAVRKFGSQIEDYAKVFNLIVLDKIIELYKLFRKEVSDTEERLNKETKQRIFTEKENDDVARETAQMCYVNYINNVAIDQLKPELLKAILVKDALIKAEDNVIGFFESCKQKGMRAIYVKETNGEKPA